MSTQNDQSELAQDVFLTNQNASSTCRNDAEVTPWEVLGYSVLVPVICAVGIAANALSLVVMSKVHFKESLYVYLKGGSIRLDQGRLG